MKKIGDYTVRGSLDEFVASGLADGAEEKIQLFDGRFDTAYKLIRFEIFSGDMTATDCAGRVATEGGLGIGDTGFWNCNEKRQIAWCGSNGGGDIGIYQNWTLVDSNNLIVEDCFVAIRTPHGTTNRINYFLEFEKYDISESLGALTMVRNKSQGSSA